MSSRPTVTALALSMLIFAPVAAQATDAEKSYLPPASLRAEPAEAAPRTANAAPSPGPAAHAQPRAAYRTRTQRVPYYHRYAYSRALWSFPFFGFYR